MDPIIINGDCIAIMAALPEASIDAIVTDPPYGLGFMGKGWDALPPGREWADECLRVLKPGGHLLAFGGTRTWHRLAVAVEDAGFELRDSIAWMYGSGFPKSLDVSKAIDKAAGATPIDTGIRSARHGGGVVGAGSSYEVSPKVPNITRPATPEAERWQGWGAALKPAFEPIVVGRKPLIGTVAANVLTYGTGAINVDGCRVAGPHDGGRWPTNVILDVSAATELDRQSGTLKSGKPGVMRKGRNDGAAYGAESRPPGTEMTGYGDSGGASRFFYVAKAGKKERPVVDGVAHPTVKPIALMRWLCRLVTPPGGRILEPFAGSGTTVEAAMLEGFDIVAIERETEYLPLIQARIDRAKAELGEVVA